MLAPTIAPQKTVTSPTMRHTLQLKIIGKDDVAAHVGQHGQRARGNDRATDGQSIQSIGQIHCIAGADDHQDDEENKRQKRQHAQVRNRPQRVDGQIRPEALDETAP